MHIAYIHQYFTKPDEKGGTRSYEIAKRLVASGHKVTMIGANSDLINENSGNSKVVYTKVDGIYVYRIQLPYSNSMGFVKRWFIFLRFAKKSYHLVKKIKNVDLVYATSTPLPVGIAGKKSARFHKCPFIFEVRDLWPELPDAMGLLKFRPLYWYLRYMELSIYKSANRIVALAPGIKEGIVESGYPSDKIAIVPNASDTDLFKPSDNKDLINSDKRYGNPDDFRLVFTGAHGIANGLDAVLDAIIVLKKRNVSNVRFCFIGTGGVKSDLKYRAQTEDINEYISWIEPIRKTKLAQVLPQMDVGMMILKNIPAFYRGTSPNKFFDYIAAGLPVLNNYPGWLAEIIRKNDIGVVVPPDNPESFSDAVLWMRDHPKRLKEMGVNARQIAVSYYSRDAQFNKINNMSTKFI